MKQRARTDWGQTLYAEWHTADKHHEFVSDEDGKMVVMRILPALCPNDKWHDGQQYASYRGAQAFEYTKQPGCKGVHPYWSRYQNFPPNAGSMTLGET